MKTDNWWTWSIASFGSPEWFWYFCHQKYKRFYIPAFPKVSPVTTSYSSPCWLFWRMFVFHWIRPFWNTRSTAEPPSWKYHFSSPRENVSSIFLWLMIDPTLVAPTSRHKTSPKLSVSRSMQCDLLWTHKPVSRTSLSTEYSGPLRSATERTFPSSKKWNRW